jgi:hypothetical protein
MASYRAMKPAWSGPEKAIPLASDEVIFQFRAA